MSSESFSVLTANVGNLSLGCKKYLFNLCYKDVEERISANVSLLNPDIVTFQELLASQQCDSVEEKNVKKVCFDKQAIPQVRRLLGDDYSIVCDNRGHFTCIAVNINFGKIKNCDLGELCINGARTGVPLDECDNGFTVSATTVEHKSGFIFDIVNAHPQSTDAICREKMLSLIFDGSETIQPLIQEENVLLMGDFNMDPWRDDDESVSYWKERLSRGWGNRLFRYHSGIAELDPPYHTSKFITRFRTFDFVVSNFAQGICHVLGVTPGTVRLDGGKGMDHRAVYGFLKIEP